MEIQLWREILSPYEQAVTELVEKFQHLSLEHRERGLYSPIEQITGRVKSITSILEKMKRKNIPFEKMEEQVEDIAGIRIICQFVEDIQRVSDLIAGRSDMEIKCIKDYIAHQKESGYRSYHLVIYYHVETLNGPKKIHHQITLHQRRILCIHNFISHRRHLTVQCNNRLCRIGKPFFDIWWNICLIFILQRMLDGCPEIHCHRSYLNLCLDLFRTI